MMSLHKPRAAIMMVFAAFGAAVGCWAGAIPHVIKAADIDSFDLGLGFTLNALAGISAMALGGMIGRHFSNRSVMLAVLPVLALNIILLLVAASPWLFFASLTAFGAVLGFLDMAMNAEASAIEHDLRRPIFTTFHGSVSIAIAFFAIVSSFLSAIAGTFATSMLGVAVLGMAWLMVYRSVPARAVTAGRAGGLSHLPSRLPLIIIGLAVGLSIAAETSTLFWSAKLLNDQAPELAAIAGLGAAFFGACNAIVQVPRRPPARQIWRGSAHAGLACARPLPDSRSSACRFHSRRMSWPSPPSVLAWPSSAPACSTWPQARCWQTAPPA